MKKFSIVFALIICMAMSVVLAGCGGNAAPEAEAEGSSLEGKTWVVTSVTTEDGEFTGEQVAEIFGGELSYSFEADGVAIAAVGENTAEATYEEGDGTVTLTANGTAYEMTYDGDTISFENETGTCVMKQK